MNALTDASGDPCPRLLSASSQVISAAAYVVFYALVAAASLLVLTATLVVIRSKRPRVNAIAFWSGFVLGTTIAAILGLMLGQAAVERFDSYDTVVGVVALLVGIALVVTGFRERHALSRPDAETGRPGAILARLSHVGPDAALSIAALLGFGGPKRLVLTLLAMASVSAADLGDVENLMLIVLYVAVATLLVSVPVGVVVVGGNRADAIIGRGESWLESNAALLRVWLAFVFGTALVVDGLVRLTG